MKELNNSGMVEIYNHQHLWDNRQYPRIYDVLRRYLGQRKALGHNRFALISTRESQPTSFQRLYHWDADTTLDPLPVNVQGVLSLVDHQPEMGGFQGVPETIPHAGGMEENSIVNRDPWKPDNNRFRNRSGHAGKPATC